jgi:plasmid maintenance system antidote protein VapI
MNLDNIKFKVKQDSVTKNIDLQIYRNCGSQKDEWVMLDRLKDLTPKELKALAEFINSLFVKK